MKTKTTKDKALAELVRKKVLYFAHDMKQICKDNELSYDISGWVENPIDRGETPEKTLKFKCGYGNIYKMLTHQIIDITQILQDCVKKFSYNEVTRLCTMSETLIGYACKKVMTNLNNKMKKKEKVTNG